jgi:hypothetical protein
VPRPFGSHLLEGDIMVERRHTERIWHNTDGSKDREYGRLHAAAHAHKCDTSRGRGTQLESSRSQASTTFRYDRAKNSREGTLYAPRIRSLSRVTFAVTRSF